MGLSMTLRGDWVAMNITPSSLRQVGRLASANPVKEGSPRSAWNSSMKHTRRRVPKSWLTTCKQVRRHRVRE